MSTLTETASDNALPYHDKKRWLWLASGSTPLICLAAIAAVPLAGAPVAMLAVPAVYIFIIVAIADAAIGRDETNPPDAAVEGLSKDRYYDYVAYALIPIHYALFIAAAFIAATSGAPIWALLLLAVGVGTVNGNMITIGHELGHRLDRKNRLMAQLALVLSGYGHFTTEHNHGHHIYVATPEDPASARFGESVYAFAWRELPGALFGGWRLQKKRLSAKGLPFFHWRNEILQTYTIAIVLAGGLTLWLGWIALPFILIHHFFAWYALTQINYIQHYGLKRQKKDNGRYEPCAPRHSWNTNFLLSNLLLLHLERHSDHHAYPMRPYQALRDWRDAPMLPAGYTACMLLAAVPPLWRRVMDPKVMKWAGGDIEKVNKGPALA